MSGTSFTEGEARQQLYELMRSDAPFEEKAEDVLEVGVEHLGVDNGHLTRIDSVTNHWEAFVSTDPPGGQFPPGLELDIEQTYCRRTIASDAPVALHDAPAQGWADDPAFQTHELYCYHGSRLVLEGEVYGTVCFVSEEPREPFSDRETMFADLLAQLLERGLELEHHDAKLTRQTNLASVLNRVLRHNIRNDVSIIRGYTQLMADELDDEHYGRTALENIDNLIELSRKARELDHIATTEFEREPTEVVSLVEAVVEDVRAAYPDATITVEAQESIAAPLHPRFERAVRELVENAAKHGGGAPTVTVSVEPVPDAVELRVEDDGPGINEQEAEVLQTGTETQLVHGSGLGLWLVYWVTTSQNGSIEVTGTEDGTTVTVTAPRRPNSTVQQQLSELSRARERYQAAFEESFDAMLIINDEARIVDANPEAVAIYGLDGQELLGRSLPEFLPDWFDFEAAWESFQEAGDERDIVPIHAADGVVRTVEYAATTDIIPDQHLLVVRDVSERLQRQRALEETTQQLEAIVEASPAAIIVVDQGGVVERWNPAAEAVFGYEANEAVGRSMRELDLIPERERASFENNVEALLGGERLTCVPVERRTADGRLVQLRLSAVPLRDEGGVSGVCVVAMAVGEENPGRD